MVCEMRNSRVKTIWFSSIEQYVKELGELLNIDVCKDVKTGKDVVNCLDNVVLKVREFLQLTNNKIDYCIKNCLEIFNQFMKVLKEVDNGSKNIIKFLTSGSDSNIKKSEAAHIVKRYIRHLKINEEITTLHVFKQIIAERLLEKLKKCLVKYCGIENVEKTIRNIINSIEKMYNELTEEEKRKYSDQVQYVTHLLNQWLQSLIND